MSLPVAPAKASAHGEALAYGALGFPLAFAALPLYVHVPALYARTLGLSLALIGALMLATRVLDALIDPWLGRWSDRLRSRFSRACLVALPLPGLACGLAALFAPAASAGIGWMLASLALTFLCFSFASINYYAWGAELGNTPERSVHFTAAREGFALAGVIAAALLPGLLASSLAHAGVGDANAGLRALAWVFPPILAVAATVTIAGATRGRSLERISGLSLMRQSSTSWRELLSDREFRRLLVVLALGGVAAAIPSTLVLFYIDDVLQAPSWQGRFLAIYFLAGAAGLPLWLRLARSIGKVRTWRVSMALAVFSFVWAFFLGAGDVLSFALICALSGAALGAELALPPALLADALSRDQRSQTSAGTCFGIWTFIGKFNLALAAGVALPLVGLFGYKASEGVVAHSEGLLALAAVYALLPALLKGLALGMLWRWRQSFSEVI